MYTERNAKFSQRLIRQDTSVSVATIRNMNSRVLTKALYQLMRLSFQESKTNICTRSALTHILRGNRTKSCSLVKIRKISKKRKRLKKEKRCCSVRLQKLEILDPSAVTKTSDVFDDGTSKIEPDKQNKVPIVYLKDVLSTQGRTSKSDFMEYFGLKAVNVPLSSDMGIIMAARENQTLSEDFKLRKIERCEWYINRPYIVKQDSCNYPSTYSNKNNRRAKHNEKSMLSIQKLLHLKKFCRPVSIKLIRSDLLKIRKNMIRNKRERILRLKKRMQKQSKSLKVMIKASEKKRVDELLRRKYYM